MSLASLRDKALVSLLFAVIVLGALAIYADLGNLLTALIQFRWELIVPILLLTLFNYGLRFVKWDFYLHLIDVRSMSRAESLLIFLSGMSMVITPGKVGEWLKSYLVKERTGTPFSRTAPIVLAERLTDGVAMLILACGGLLLVQTGWQLLVVVFVGAIVIVGVVQRRSLALRILEFAERLPVIGTRVHHLHEFYESSYRLLQWRSLGFAIGLGVVSWAGECVAYYLVFLGLGVEPSWRLLVQSTFMLASATLAGAIVLLPGGLGVAEGGLTAMAQVLVGLTADKATAAALLIRFCTLWFGLLLGIAALAVTTRRFPQALRSSEQPG